jgi:ApeA N-terminal domain 1
MNRIFEFKGYWRESERPEKTLAGILKFIPNKGGYLTLMGSFKNLDISDLGQERDFKKILEEIKCNPKFQEKEQIDIILGLTLDAKPITLKNCLESDFSISVYHNELLIRTEYRIQMVIVGAFLPSDMKLRDVSVIFSHIDEWITNFGIGRYIDNKGEFYLGAVNPNQQVFSIRDDLSVILETFTKVDESRNLQRSLTKTSVEQNVLFKYILHIE